jgi:hypothetical protein
LYLNRIPNTLVTAVDGQIPHDRDGRSESGGKVNRDAPISLAILGVAVSVLGIVLALVVWLVTPDTRVSIVWPLAVGGVLLALCCVLADMLRASISEAELKLPRILACLGDVAHVVSGRLLLVEPSRLLGHGMAVSIYTMQNEFEILIGDGVVQNIQQD